MQQPLSARDEVWLLTDGHAGNVRQARALAAALEVQVREFTLEPRAPWRWLSPRGLPGASRAFGHAFAQALRAPPRLTIGCGRQSALATRLAREAGARCVQILDPRIDAAHWDLVVVPEHDRLRGANVITLLGSLNPVDEAWLAAARAAFPALAAPAGPKTALLVGGPGPHFALDDAAFAQAAHVLASTAAGEAGCLWITASRRTPPAWRSCMAALRQRPGVRVWLDERDGENPYAGFLACADRIVCTADSVNMVSEAAATHAPVFVLGRAQLQGRPRGFVDTLRDAGRVRDAEQGLEVFKSTPLRETQRVAREVARRLSLGTVGA